MSVVGVNMAEIMNAPTKANFLFSFKIPGLIIPREDNPPIITGRLNTRPSKVMKIRRKFR